MNTRTWLIINVMIWYQHHLDIRSRDITWTSYHLILMIWYQHHLDIISLTPISTSYHSHQTGIVSYPTILRRISFMLHFISYHVAIMILQVWWDSSTHLYISIHISIHIYTPIHIYTHIISTHLYISIHISLHISLHVYTHIYTHIYTYLYISIRFRVRAIIYIDSDIWYD